MPAPGVLRKCPGLDRGDGKGFTRRPFCGEIGMAGFPAARLSAVTLIHNYIYKEVVVLTAAIIGVLTFLLVGLELFKVVALILYTDLPLWLTAKFVLLLIPFTLTLTIPTGLLAAVLIVLGRMSSDRELLALKASGVGLAPIVAPVFIIAVVLMLLDFWLIASVNPECRKEYNEMKHEIVTNNPMALFTPELVLDKIPGWRIYFSAKKGTELDDLRLWQLNDQDKVMSTIRADRAIINLDSEHQQLVMTLFNEHQSQYPADGNPMNVQPGGSAGQFPVTVSLSVACVTFVFVGIPLAIQTQRKETSVGIALTIVIVGLYMLLEAVGRGLKAKAGFYPELIIWAPNLIFQAIGFWLFHRANQK
jgi:lipopolysaccharide export system permease protein